MASWGEPIDKVEYTVERDRIRGWMVTTEDAHRGVMSSSFISWESAMGALLRRIEHDAWDLKQEIAADD